VASCLLEECVGVLQDVIAKEPLRLILFDRPGTEVNKRPNFRQRMATRRVHGIEWKGFVQPIGEEVDQSPLFQEILNSKRHDLGDPSTGKTD